MNYPATLRALRIPTWVWAIIVLLHALALGWQLYHQQPFFPDSDRYVQAARNLRDVGVLYALPLTKQPLQAQEYSIRPPGYPLFLLVFGADGNRFPLVGLVLQNLLSLLNIGLALRWVVRTSEGLSRLQWVLLLCLLATAPSQFIYANVLMSEILLQTLVVILWLALMAFGQPTGKLWHAGVAAAAAAASLLIKPVFFPLAAVLLLLGLAYAWKRKQALLVVISALPLVVALLWMGRNETQTGYFHFSSIAEINLLRYNVRGVLQKTEGPTAAEHFVATTVAASEQQPDFKQQQQYIQQASSAVLRKYPVAYASQHLRGMVNFFLDPGRFDLVYFLGLSEATGTGLLQQLNQQGYGAILAYARQLPLGLLSLMLLILIANVARLALALHFLLASHSGWVPRLVLAGMVGYVAFLTGPLGAARFVVPVLPLLLAAAGVGMKLFEKSARG